MDGRVGFLGPNGTYSQLAAEIICGNGTLVAYHSFPALFSALDTGEVSAIVIPVRNTVNGAVTQNLDLLEEYDGAFAVQMCTVTLDHRLVTMKGVGLDKIRRVYSHPQALAQCAKFIAEKLPLARTYATSSTAECLGMITDESCAGIVGAHVDACGFQMSENAISDIKNNSTSFLKVVKKEGEQGDYSGERALFCFTLRHKAGALYKALEILAAHGVNMTEIESRPIKDRPGEYRFFVEAECGNRAETDAAFLELKAMTFSFKLLGGY